jgi:hypothetical protein
MRTSALTPATPLPGRRPSRWISPRTTLDKSAAPDLVLNDPNAWLSEPGADDDSGYAAIGFGRRGSVGSRDTKLPFGWQTRSMTRRAASVEESEVEVATATLPEDELIRKASEDRTAGRDASGDVEALLSVAADQNQAALDRLAK